MTSTTKYSLLLIISTFSAYILSPYDFYSISETDTNPYIEFFQFLSPGISFSIYLLLLYWTQTTTKKKTLSFFALLGFYYLSLWASFSSWGMLVPVMGGLGAYLIKRLFNLNVKGYVLTYLGVLSSLIGLIFFYLLNNTLTAGMRFGIIIGLWQLAVGYKCASVNEVKPV